MTPYYEHGGITIYHGDCREIVPSLGRFELLLTDPPYGTQELGGGYGRRQNHDIGDGRGRVIANDTDLSALKDVFPKCLHKIEAGWALAFFSARKMPAFLEATDASKWFGEIVWDKGSPGLGYHVRYSHESIGVFRIGEPPRPPRPILSVLRAGAPADEHPHEKPLSLMTTLCEWGSPEGGSVIDPFCGTGNTLVAAKNLNRLATGIEIEERYAEIAARRLEQEVFAF